MLPGLLCLAAASLSFCVRVNHMRSPADGMSYIGWLKFLLFFLKKLVTNTDKPNR